jgi:transposase
MILASARGDWAPHIARSLGCNDQTVRNTIKAFNATGVACLTRGSSRPHTMRAAFDADGVERLRELLHHSPRSWGKLTSRWTLALAAEVSFEQGLTAKRVSAETIRATLARLGVRWQRATHWITSPDPAYARKKRRVTA